MGSNLRCAFARVAVTRSRYLAVGSPCFRGTAQLRQVEYTMRGRSPWHFSQVEVEAR